MTWQSAISSIPPIGHPAGGMLETSRRLTDEEAAALKAEWLRVYRRRQPLVVLGESLTPLARPNRSTDIDALMKAVQS